MSKWIAIANSFKFRTLMVMVDADPSKADDIKKMMDEKKMITSAAGNMEFQYSETAGNENPKYGILAKYTGGINTMFLHITMYLNQWKIRRLTYSTLFRSGT